MKNKIKKIEIFSLCDNNPSSFLDKMMVNFDRSIMWGAYVTLYNSENPMYDFISVEGKNLNELLEKLQELNEEVNGENAN